MSGRVRRMLAVVIASSVSCGPCDEATPLSAGTGAAEHCEIGGSKTARIQQWLECMNAQKYRTWAGWKGDARIRPTGPLIGTRGFMLHQRVRAWYSPEVIDWMELPDLERRRTDIPAGAEIVKEMYVDDPARADAEVLDGIAYMRRTSETQDGWLWGLWFRKDSPTFGGKGFPGFASLEAGHSFCLSCHASTDNSSLTFSHLGNLTGDGEVAYTMIHDVLAGPPPPAPAVDPHAAFVLGTMESESGDGAGDDEAWLPERRSFLPVRQPSSADGGVSRALIPGLVLQDFAPAKSAERASPFISSDGCQYCHDIAYLQNGRTPAMFEKGPPGPNQEPWQGPEYNLSPFGEWSASLMGLSARDPVFLAQLEAEQRTFPQHAARIGDFCLRCHAPLGQRAHEAAGPPDESMPVDVLYRKPDDAQGEIGSLARDGVTCVVCHRMSPKGLGEPATYNARFELEEQPVIYGPFDDPNVHPMSKAVGLSPKGGQHMRSSKLCSTCHTVMPVIIGADGRWDEDNERSHEQTTWMEWYDSDYNQDQAGAEGKQCQDCHMPRNFDLLEQSIDQLRYPIANIQTETFPHQPSLAPRPELETKRRPYRRHTLVGINLTTLEFFCQFDKLGDWSFSQNDVGIPLTNQYGRLHLAATEALRLARERTATVEIGELSEDFERGRVVVPVRVESLTGHKLPTGVHFRRMFLDLRVMAGGRVLWRSGARDASGVLLGSDGKPLASERDARSVEAMQPDRDDIDSQDQVQIYEERFSFEDARGARELTTSFLRLQHREKDNRILPKGWSEARRFADVTGPYGMKTLEVGGDSIRYHVPMFPEATHVVVELVYQSLPRYYLDERTADAAGREAGRLAHLVKEVEHTGRPTQDWGLTLASDRVPWLGHDSVPPAPVERQTVCPPPRLRAER